MKIIARSPKGVPDILPSEQKYWDFVSNIVNQRCAAFGFEKITLPIFEDVRLYQKGTGLSTDVVQKEMYEVRYSKKEDMKQDDTIFALRPEFTPSACRAYLEHAMFTKPQPVKLLSMGPLFRHDKPQKGRYRQFHQFNLEVIGNKDPLTDALLILLLSQIYMDLGLKNEIVLEINNIGCKKCQPKIKKGILNSLEKYQNKLCPDCQSRIYTNPLRILDCKDEKCKKILEYVPHIIDLICPECKKHFMLVLEYLDELKVAYDLNPFLVRGFDYYTSTTFEIRDKKDSAKKASLGGGGRYDQLIKLYGGSDTPAIGFAGGMERIIEKIKELDIKIPDKNCTDIFIIQIGKEAKKLALSLIAELSEKNYHVSCAVGKDTLSSQLKIANKVNAKFSIIIGQREILDKTIIIKNMINTTQETIELNELESYLNEKLINETSQ